MIYYWIYDIDCPDDLALLANTPTQVESLLVGLEQAAAAAGGIGLYMNTNKTVHMFEIKSIHLHSM